MEPTPPPTPPEPPEPPTPPPPTPTPTPTSQEFANAAADAAVCAAYAASDAASSASSSAADTAYAARASAASSAAAYDAYAAYADTAVLVDIQRIKPSKGAPHKELLALLSSRLWQEAVPPKFEALVAKLSSDLQVLGAGFEVWIDWYQDRLDGKPFNWEIERQCAMLSKEQLSQSPAEINAYLKALRDGTLTKQLKRVRAIFIGHGEVGKTSLINVLQGGEAEPPTINDKRDCNQGRD